MGPRVIACLALGALLCAPAVQGAQKKSAKPPAAEKAALDHTSEHHEFGVIGHSFHGSGSGEARLKKALEDESEAALAFVVVTGIKAVEEPCSDRLYAKRRELLDDAKRPVIVLPSASDWSECRNSAGRSNAPERLNRLRELLYPEPESLGAHKLKLTRQSSNPKFRSYAENVHWQVDEVLYATINLPANNNHFRPEAGRNSEFEDRLVANRFWLQRLFAMARREKMRPWSCFPKATSRRWPSAAASPPCSTAPAPRPTVLKNRAARSPPCPPSSMARCCWSTRI